MSIKVLIRGGGDLASGVAARLHRAGMKLLITELAHPMVVRRTVSFAEAVFAGEVQVEEILATRVQSFDEIAELQQKNQIAVMVDPDMEILQKYKPAIIVDARMKKSYSKTGTDLADLVIGMGPGFTAGENCHVIVETLRGHHLGRVIRQGSALPNTNTPDSVDGMKAERVLRAPKAGILKSFAEIGQSLETGDLIAEVGGVQILAPFNGVLRGLIKEGLEMSEGLKVGDVDPRDDKQYCYLISDKALAIGGGVLEAILSQASFSVQRSE